MQTETEPHLTASGLNICIMSVTNVLLWGLGYTNSVELHMSAREALLAKLNRQFVGFRVYKSDFAHLRALEALREKLNWQFVFN